MAVMDSMTLKILALAATFLAISSCAKREEAVVTPDKGEPRQGGTVIMVTGPGATPPPATPGALNPTEPLVAATNPLANPPAPPNVRGAALSAAVPVAPPPPPTAVEVNTLSTTERVGLLECDTFVDRYVSCLNKNVPAERQAPLVRGLESDIRRWQTMAASAAGRTDAANECQRAFDRTRQVMTPYGCTWE
ncbi:MAG TPA: hypothetical protein VJR29_14615 [bacterium]|nr:hypothetical protein [bacterium]